MTNGPYLDRKNKQVVSDQSSVSFQSHNTIRVLDLSNTRCICLSKLFTVGRIALKK